MLSNYVKAPALEGLNIAGKLVFCSTFFFICLYLSSSESVLSPFEEFPTGGDSLIALSILDWGSRCIFNSNIDCADFPIFYPTDNTLFLTEHMLGISIIYSVFKLLIGEMHAAFNFSIISIFLLNFSSSFWLFRRGFSAGVFIACAAASIFTFQPFLSFYLPHIHLLPIFPLPLILLFLKRLFDNNKENYLLISAAIGIQFWFGMSLGVFALTLTLLCFVYLFVFYSSFRVDFLKNFLLHLKYIILSILLLGALLFPLYLNYSSIDVSHNLERSFHDIVSYSYEVMGFLNFVLGSDLFNSYISSNVNFINPTEYRFLSHTTFFSFAIGALLLIFDRNNKDNCFLGLSVLLGLIFIVLSLGPYLIFNSENLNIPMPYIAFYYLIPGFDSMRVPVRFIILVNVMASISFALILVRTKSALESIRMQKNRGEIVFILVTISVFAASWFTDRGLARYSNISISNLIKAVPEKYTEINSGNIGAVVLDFPMWPPHFASDYMYYQLYDQNPRIGGVSSNFPQSFFHTVNATAFCPRDDCFQAIQNSNADIFVVHLDKLDEESKNKWSLHEKGFYDFELVNKDSRVLVWQRVK